MTGGRFLLSGKCERILHSRAWGGGKFLTGWAELLSQANQFFGLALTCDSNNIEVIAGVAGIDILRVINFFADDRTATFAGAEVTLTKALSLAPGHALAH